MADSPAPRLKPEVRGWLRHLWRKAMTPDDWSRGGEPHPWWDRYSLKPMLSFPRFDLSESSYAFLLLARKTPAWREVYTRILDELLRRHTTWWAAVDWLTQIGPDPDRARYPKAYKRLIPKDLWGQYDAPGWTANGVEPWGLQPDPIGASGNLFFRGFFNLMLAIHREVSGESTWDRPFEMTGLEDRTFSWTHRGIADHLSSQWAETPHGPHCENTKSWPFCLSAAGLGLKLTDETLGTETHWVYDRWVEDMFKKKYMGFDGRGNLKWVALYYDPILDRVHGRNRILGLFPAIYVAPQNRAVGELLYRNAVFRYGERYPRGQESALYLLKDLLDGEGDWWRAFNEPDREKFTAPTVTDSDYPRMGFSVAWNDTERGVLELESFAATSSARGEATRFSVRNLPNAGAVRVSRDGRDHAGWRATGPDSIEIETTIGSHRYEIFTGYRGSEAARAGRAPRSVAAGPAPVAGVATRARTSPVEIATALATVSAGVASCPCCAGALV